MKVHEIIQESEQLDEISLKTLGNVAKFVGKTITNAPRLATAAAGAYYSAQDASKEPPKQPPAQVAQAAQPKQTKQIDTKQPKLVSKTSKKTPTPVKETATAGATSAASIGTIANPHISPGKARGKKSYTGSMATGSGTKAPPQPKVVQPKTSSGTAKNALDMNTSLFGAATVKRR